MTSPESGYKLVQLVNGVYSVHSLSHRETFHPVIGPVAEAEALYVKQLKLPERMAADPGEFVIWDVGLGAAANVLTVLRGLLANQGRLHIVSFDHTLEPLRFALNNGEKLGYITGFETELETLLREQIVQFQQQKLEVTWRVHVGDFPSLIVSEGAAQWPKPHAILFDAFSPAKNPAMWTLPLFSSIYRLLDPERPCALPTYSRSTMLRVSLLLAGFYVGSGHATGEKEETTIASNTMALVSEPLSKAWLKRVRNSTSAEPLMEPAYRQAPVSSETWNSLARHRQFQ